MTLSLVAPTTLRDPGAELALVGSYAGNVAWLERWPIPAAWLTSTEARRLYGALGELMARGEAVTPATVATAAGIAPAIFDAPDVLAVPPDPPGLVRRLHALHALRRLRLVALAIAHRAEQPGADPMGIAETLGAALHETAAACPLPRRQRVEVAA